MVRVKVCGIRSREDALFCLQQGVHALGLVFHRRSPRYISPVEASLLIRSLPPLVSWVGVFVDREPDEVLAIARQVGLDTIQLHGSESPRVCLYLMEEGLRVIKALRIRSPADLRGWEAYRGRVSAILLDTRVDGTPGGSGRTFPWEVSRRITGLPVILAGGLNPQNVREAIRAVKPWGVDVSSGVEKAPGVKDPGLIEEFMKKVRGG